QAAARAESRTFSASSTRCTPRTSSCRGGARSRCSGARLLPGEAYQAATQGSGKTRIAAHDRPQRPGDPPADAALDLPEHRLLLRQRAAHLAQLQVQPAYVARACLEVLPRRAPSFVGLFEQRLVAAKFGARLPEGCVLRAYSRAQVPDGPFDLGLLPAQP